jgi:Flp pilus assembly protein TadD
MHLTVRRCAVVAAILGGLSIAGPASAMPSSGNPDRASTPARPASKDFENAKASIAARQYANAIGWLQRVIAAEPSNPEAYNLMGYATRKSGDAQGSLEFYQKALSLDPKHLGAHEYIGEAYLMLDRLQQAEEHLARLDQLCTFGCTEYRTLKAAIANYRKGIKPQASN